jgi:hypothetical protein
LRRGGYLLSADVEPELYDRAVEVVDSGGAVDMDERESTWKSSGWTGETSPPPRTPPAVAPARAGLPPFDEGAVWGMRDNSHGRTRLRSYRYGAEADEAADERFSSSVDSGKIAEHMEVIASDGVKIGTVDHLEAGAIKLAKSTSPDGAHHFIPLAWVDHVDTHVHLTKTTADARANW